MSTGDVLGLTVLILVFVAFFDQLFDYAKDKIK